MAGKTLGQCILCLLLAAVCLGQTMIVTLKDGRKIIGEVTKTEDGYLVKRKIGSGVASIPLRKDEVASIEEIVTPEQEYKDRLKKIDPKSPRDRLDLAKWAMGKNLLAIARTECEEALKLDPEFERARLLLRQIEAKEKKAAGGGKKPPTVKPKGPSGQAPPDSQIPPEWLVTEEDIYKVRLEELTGADLKVAVQFQNKVIDRFIEKMRGQGEFQTRKFEQYFRSWGRAKQAFFMLTKIDRDEVGIKDDIQIKTDPKFILDFRNKIWPVIGSTCASVNCHGSPKGKGGLKLINVSGRSDKVLYSNFLIMDKFSGRQKMIDRGTPDLSLLLQHALPREIARYKHPEKGKFAPPLRDLNAPAYKFALAWIESLAKPHPSYRVKYKPPFGRTGGGGDFLDRVRDEVKDPPEKPAAPKPVGK
jgi:hypothetical protein